MAASGAAQVFLCGPHMEALWHKLGAGAARRAPAGFGGAAGEVAAALQAGDVIAVKGSLGSKMKLSSMPSWRQATARRDAEMFYNLVYPLADVFSPFNLFRYLTFRSIAAFLTALILSFLIGGGLIRWLRSKQGQGQPIRDDGPATHLVPRRARRPWAGC